MTYDERVAYILSIPKFTKKNEPSHTREFLKRLGNPQECFEVIHVAGSNGKGSVCAFINSVFLEEKLPVGMFTSPHLVDIRERFMVNGSPCTQGQFLEAEQEVCQVVEGMQADEMAHPTFFEYIFAIGMVVFRNAGVKCAIVETGLGGRLDATNIVKKPLLTIITSISLEHTEILGNTIQEIATEKAGIIKDRVPVIFDGSEELAEQVILKIAQQKQAPVEKISKNAIKILLNDGKNIDFSMDSEYDVTRVRIPFPAEYQVMNGALALVAVNKLKKSFPISEKAITEGFRKMKWWGRMEEVLPEVYLDGAHNVSGVQAFLQAAGQMTKEAGILLFSMVKEKDYQKAIQLLCQQGNFSEIILTTIKDNERALSLECLKQCFQENLTANVKIITIEEPQEAFRQAVMDRKEGQKVFCIGSLYLVGELKKIAGGYRNDRF